MMRIASESGCPKLSFFLTKMRDRHSDAVTLPCSTPTCNNRWGSVQMCKAEADLSFSYSASMTGFVHLASDCQQ